MCLKQNLRDRETEARGHRQQKSGNKLKAFTSLKVHFRAITYCVQGCYSSRGPCSESCCSPHFCSRCSSEMIAANLLLCRNVLCSSSLTFLLEESRGEGVVAFLSTGHALLSDGSGSGAMTTAQMGRGNPCPGTDACLTTPACIQRFNDFLS